MAPRKKSVSEDTPNVDVMDKIAGLLAAYVTKDMKQEDAALMLDGIGFTSKEIISILGVHDSFVRKARFLRKQQGSKKRKAKAS